MCRLTTLLLLILGSFAHANWEVRIASEDFSYAPGRASIQYKPIDGDIATFGEAIDHLRETGHLDRLEVITIFGGAMRPPFQSELIETLERLAPEEFAEARASSGNPNNPAMDSLRAVFNDVVFEMPTVRRLDAELRDAGRTIDHVSHEKLWLTERDGELFIIVMIWLSVEPV